MPRGLDQDDGRPGAGGLEGDGGAVSRDHLAGPGRAVLARCHIGHERILCPGGRRPHDSAAGQAEAVSAVDSAPATSRLRRRARWHGGWHGTVRHRHRRAARVVHRAGPGGREVSGCDDQGAVRRLRLRRPRSRPDAAVRHRHRRRRRGRRSLSAALLRRGRPAGGARGRAAGRRRGRQLPPARGPRGRQPPLPGHTDRGAARRDRPRPTSPTTRCAVPAWTSRASGSSR